MAHKHDVYDSDPHFVIDADTRLITYMSDEKPTLMQYDHNSERFTFEIPRIIDEHDMSNCDRVEIHYINIGTNGQRTNGLYEVDDMRVDPDNNERVQCTWLISQNATSLVGTLSFILRFICTNNGVIEYVWNTAIYSSVPIGNGMSNTETVLTQYADVLQNWYNELILAGDSALAKIEQKKDEIIASISEEKIVESVTDAATEATIDKLNVDTIVNEVLSRLPQAEGASF